VPRILGKRFNGEEFYVSYARHMHEEHYWDEDAILYFFGKPWKWNDEIEKWVNDDNDKCTECYE